MNILRDFPFRRVLGLASRPDRREAIERELRAHQIDAEFVEGLPGEVCGGDQKGYGSVRKRAQCMTLVSLLREAQERCAKAVLLFEDDLFIGRNFAARVADLKLPEDWGMFYFGGLHMTVPNRVAPGLVRTRRVLDIHAFAINSGAIDAVVEVLLKGEYGGENLVSDVLISDLHETIPTYVAYPNLIWQTPGYSDHTGMVYSNYSAEGVQLFFSHIITEFEDKSKTGER